MIELMFALLNVFIITSINESNTCMCKNPRIYDQLYTQAQTLTIIIIMLIQHCCCCCLPIQQSTGKVKPGKQWPNRVAIVCFHANFDPQMKVFGT